MTPTKPDVSIAGRYSVSNAATALGVDRHTLRKWAKAGKLMPGGVSSNGRTWFSGRAILDLWKAFWEAQ